ncbi:MAG TPA: hypothetical protein VGQ42_16810 [Candidatus Dormibacteraeota bacterium]|nr:hypothetical protein [Candidatus Dormibacteraeota bacterium]
MLRLVRGTPVVRALVSLAAVVLVLSGAIPLLLYPLLRLDAGSFSGAIRDLHAQCAGNAIPARGGCWSAAPARVIISGVDTSGASTVGFVVLEVKGEPSVRADFVDHPGVDGVARGTAVTARYWHGDVAMVVLAGAGKGAPALMLETRDSPAFRASQFPAASLVSLLLGGAALAVWGMPLLADVREWRRRRRDDGYGDAELRAVAQSPAVANRLARYSLGTAPTPARAPGPASSAAPAATPAPETTLTGRRDWPPPAPSPRPDPVQPQGAPQHGGSGWNIRRD